MNYPQLTQDLLDKYGVATNSYYLGETKAGRFYVYYPSTFYVLRFTSKKIDKIKNFQKPAKSLSFLDKIQEEDHHDRWSKAELLHTNHVKGVRIEVAWRLGHFTKNEEHYRKEDRKINKTYHHGAYHLFNILNQATFSGSFCWAIGGAIFHYKEHLSEHRSNETIQKNVKKLADFDMLSYQNLGNGNYQIKFNHKLVNIDLNLVPNFFEELIY